MTGLKPGVQGSGDASPKFGTDYFGSGRTIVQTGSQARQMLGLMEGLAHDAFSICIYAYVQKLLQFVLDTFVRLNCFKLK